MNTRNIDLAAYLHLCGMDPVEVVQHTTAGGLEFRYRSTEFLQAAVQAYLHDAMVPVRGFCEARAKMKGLNPGRGKAVENFNRAVESACLQAGRGR
jgi:hypothetical protein